MYNPSVLPAVQTSLALYACGGNKLTVVKAAVSGDIETTSFSNWMVHHHVDRPTCKITSMSISLTDGLNALWSTTCHLPSGYPEVLTYLR
ncbi:hypothetical protein TNCV_2041771 [Trichonephila clavipes]|nr:hypothetical protein TNCV_2041771 [Trichonephila clavipes]